MKAETLNYKTFRKQRSTRLKNFVYSKPFAYFITICTQERQPHFANPSIARVAMDTIREIGSNYGYKIYSFCVMPDHLHILVNPSDSGMSLPKFMQILKSKIAVLILKQTGINQLWQKSYYEHVLRKSEDLLETVNYILNNPVRKGLVEDYRGYAFCGVLDEFE